MNIEEISEGLRLAMSRGESLEQATQSFVSSGYSLQDVQQASANLSSPQQLQVSQVPPLLNASVPQQPTLQPLQPSQPQPTQGPSQPIQTPISQPLQTPQQNLPLSVPLQSPQISQPLQPQPIQPVSSSLSSQPLSPQIVPQVVKNVQPLPIQNQVVVPAAIPVPTQITPQMASIYGIPQEQQKNPRDTLIVLIIFLLIILGGIMTAIILFKESIIGFMNNLF